MSKAMLIMDIPENCRLCPCSSTENKWCQHSDRKIEKPNGKPDWCPLREVPEKQNLDIQTCSALSFSEEEIDMARGYNACIDEILGGKDEKQRTY